MNEIKNIVPVARPWLDEREVEAAKRVILSGWVTQGPEVLAFEKEFASFVKAKYATAVSSCTAALHLALLAVGVQPGDEVITVSHSFIATANSIRYCGATPVFVDIQPETFNMDPTRIENIITERTSAILCVHQLGMPCDLRSILDISHNYNIPVVEDAACAIGSEILWDNKWEKIGKPHGDVACFSFHPRKIITTGDGGMITTSNSEWDKQFHMWRQHSMNLSDVVRHGSKEVIFESYPELGYNYRMTDIQAAIGREQLKRLSNIIDRRRYLAERYKKLLANASWIRLPEEPSWARSNWQSFCVQIESFDQRTVMQELLAAGVASRRGVMCAHREPAYDNESWSCGEDRNSCGCVSDTCMQLIKSKWAQDSSIILPLFPQMTEDQQDIVINALYQVGKNMIPGV
ncbi:MAG TPA: DegT/DnrJ/EryC1/StrS family aminotransferase [Candidatus Methylomirabilis sp.]|nr:DegT/DnrJ/EryC1/StrS family aminotransferase [Candidatus Methylomirabilis sp.]